VLARILRKSVRRKERAFLPTQKRQKPLVGAQPQTLHRTALPLLCRQDVTHVAHSSLHGKTQRRALRANQQTCEPMIVRPSASADQDDDAEGVDLFPSLFKDSVNEGHSCQSVAVVAG
jgi:hypothetical protein